MSQTTILSNQSGHLPLKVVFEGKDVSSPFITQVRLGNTGKVELKADDFDGPIRISFNDSVILQVRLSGRSSEAINPAVSKDASFKSISFTPTLLNSGEWIEYQLIADGPLEAPKVYARVAGNDSSDTDSLAQRRKRIELAGLIILGGGTLLTLIGMWVGQGDENWLPAIGLVTIMIGFTTMNRASSSSVWTKLPAAKKAKRARK